MAKLPRPNSAELKRLVRGSAERDLYRILYEHRNRYMTMPELRRLAGGRATHEQLGRRKRALHPFFVFERKRAGQEFKLVARKPTVSADEANISEKDRAAVLSLGRCAMCGKVPLEDGVKLQVDHKIPQSWGGKSELDNLQPLCEQCNRGKKDLFSSLDDNADRIRAAVNEDEPHKRIGELLKAFEGEWVPSYLIGIVASAKQYQEDWQKRMRELRVLGWDYKYARKKIGGRVVTSYTLTEWKPWPRGKVRAEIARREAAKRGRG